MPCMAPRDVSGGAIDSTKLKSTGSRAEGGCADLDEDLTLRKYLAGGYPRHFGPGRLAF